jgi:phosphatidylinositol alpha-1,6-mannosyltransferase
VSRLVLDVLTDASVRRPRCIELETESHGRAPATTARLRFGLRIASAQLFGPCDWMVYTHLHLAAAQRAIPRFMTRPYAVFLHDVEAWTPLSPAMRNVLAGAFLRLANSSYTAARVEAANPGCGGVVACPPGVPPPTVQPGASGVDIRAHDVVVVGRMHPNERYKGHDQLIETWPSVVRRVPDARLVCVGEGDDVSRLRDKAASAGVASKVMFSGFVDAGSLAGIYRHAAMLAMPSRREGFGLVYIEAMAAGLPCSGSIHDAASEVVVDGETGYLVDQDDRETLADRIVGLLQDESLRRRFGDAGRVRHQHLFTYEAFRSRLNGHIASALPLNVRVAHERRYQAGAG